MENPQAPEKIDSSGLLWAFVSYALWGFFPVYWKLLISISSMEILAHRMFWSFIFYLMIFIGFSFRQLPSLLKQSKRDWILSAIASVLLTLNWGIYIYAVNSNHILEGSLAYFINPLLNIVVGVAFFKESFPIMLKLAIFFAALGVLAKVAYSPSFPWISIVLAMTFCAYGVTKKLIKVPAQTSSVLEGTIGALPALIAIFYFQGKHAVEVPSSIWILLVMGGVVTGLPLFLFSYAAQRIPYSLMGMIQFIAPSLQFLVGIYIFHEGFSGLDLTSFGLIWIGVLFYLTNLVFNWQKVRTPKIS